MSFIPTQNIKRHASMAGDQILPMIHTNSDHTIAIDGTENTFSMEAQFAEGGAFIPVKNATLENGVNLIEIGGCLKLKLIPTDKVAEFTVTISSY
jgi:hypothetical protein